MANLLKRLLELLLERREGILCSGSNVIGWPFTGLEKDEFETLKEFLGEGWPND